MKKIKNLSKFFLFIGIIFFLNFQNIQLANADFSSWLFEKISSILEIKENEKTSIGEFTKKIEKNILENSDELEKILESEKVLEKITSCDVLSEIIGKNKTQNYPVLYRGFGGGEVGIMEDFAEESVSVSKTISDSNSNNFSKTNVQVKGVDEGDIVKNDGRFIYILSNSSKSVKIFDTKKSEKIGEINFQEKNFYAKEIYISGEGENKKLVLIGSGYEEMKKNKNNKKNNLKIYFGGKNFVKIFIYDLKNLEKIADNKTKNYSSKFFKELKIQRKIFFEGNFAKSRLIGEKLFLITKKYSIDFYWGEKNEENIGEKNIPEFLDNPYPSPLPKGEGIKGYEFQKTAKCGEIEFFPGSEKTDFVTVSKINLSDKNSKIQKKIFLGDLDKIYMSQKNLFIASGVRGKDEKTGRIMPFWNWDNTQIVKFGLENLELKNIGKVKGRILNQFSMDEFEGNFRIATTSNENIVEIGEKGEEIFGNEIQNNLFILDKNLKQIGKITGIAKGEQIKSVRFMGDRAFIVTFKNMDPFFVLDLKDPKNPKILGELKIPGWSDYLHPFGKNYILGFGKDVKSGKNGVLKDGDENFEDDFKWSDVGGMKISLFDITDLKNPKEKFSWKTGKRGTYSDVLNNHKALFFEQKDEQNAILGFHLLEKNTIKFEQKNCFKFNFSNCPTDVCQKRCTPTSPDYKKGDCDGPGSCVYQRKFDGWNIRTNFAGAVFLKIDAENGFSELKRISNFSKKDLLKNKYFYEKNGEKISRIVRIGDKYFGISENSVIQVGGDFGKEKKFLINK